MYLGCEELQRGRLRYDHFLLVSTFKLKLQAYKNAEKKRKKVNLEALKYIENRIITQIILVNI